MKFLVVNFHYIGDEHEYERGIYPVSKERLATQLDLLGSRFTFVSGDEVRNAVAGNKTLPEYACLITFDDGLACQVTDALPVLDAKGVPALFFVPSAPFTTGRMLAVHKIHRLLAEHNPSDLKDACIDAMQNLDMVVDMAQLESEALMKYRYDTKDAATLKYLLNRHLPHRLARVIVDKVFSVSGYNEPELVQRVYMNPHNVKTLGARGYLGMHGHDHMPLIGERTTLVSTLGENKRILEDMSGSSLYAISYPYGNKIDVSPEMPSIARSLGIELGFTMERSFNTTLRDPFFLARADTNDVLGGKRPLMQLADSGEMIVSDGFVKSRRLFIVEE